MTTVAHRLGAIELIELGNSRVNNTPVLRRPFLANARKHEPELPPLLLGGAELGFAFSWAGVGSFLTGAFEFVLSTLADLIKIPLDLISKGVGLLFDGLAGLLVNVPIIGVLASEVLLLTKSLIQWGLSLPWMLLDGLGNVFGEIKKAIDATQSADKKKEDEKKAKDNIGNKADAKGGAEFKDAVMQAINGDKPTSSTGSTLPGTPNQQGQNLPAGADEVGTSTSSGATQQGLEKAISIGLPVAGAAVLVFLAVS